MMETDEKDKFDWVTCYARGLKRIKFLDGHAVFPEAKNIPVSLVSIASLKGGDDQNELVKYFNGKLTKEDCQFALIWFEANFHLMDYEKKYGTDKKA